jgi:EmrB/QacA subfamily drug resistance transporter
MSDRSRTVWSFAVTAVALFMVALDNLVVITALPVIKHDLGASLSSLEWTVNAYTLTYAVLLLTGAALGERFGRKRMFVIGLAIFTAASAAAALAPSVQALIAARAVQGVGGAIVTPLTLTILSATVSPARRGLALGAQGGVSGLAVAIGPLVGGAVAQGLSWHWIFWLNVPIGLVVLLLGLVRLPEGGGVKVPLDLPGLGLVSAGLLAIVFGLVRGSEQSWGSLAVAGPLAGGGALLATFVTWELRSRTPMVPMRLFRSRRFSMANAAGLLMYFGLFGSVFLLAQFLQVVQGYSPVQAGLRTLPWTGMPILVTPIAGALSDRIGSRSLMVAGMALMSGALVWLSAVVSPAVPYVDLIGPFAMAGFGMSLFFAPAASVVLSAVRRQDEGTASGVSNTVREVGGVLGVAALATVFAAAGSYASPAAFVSGLTAAVWVGAIVLGLGAIAALAIPARARLVVYRHEPGSEVEAGVA